FRQWFVEEAEEGWEVVKVKDVCKTITKGTTPTTLGNSFTETGVNFLKAESLTDVGDLLENKFSHIDEATNEKHSRAKMEINDLIITIAGTIGRVAIVPERVLPANTNQALAILRLAKNTISHTFLYCLFKSTEVRNDFESRVVHAVQPNLSLGEIGDISFKLPPKGKLEFGEKELELIFQKKEKNNIQIRTLTRLRDTLLPKLMSGEVRVEYENN
ncbi:MAG: restriction endonuclease subunit S, partial [Clostridiales bacterium]|nr:restriction endonuclease subunit S [Clostridiales bacterium]